MPRIHRCAVRVILFGAAMLAGSLPAFAQTRTERWYRFEIGGFIIKDLPPAKVVISGKEYIDGIEYERFTLDADEGKFEVRGTALSGRLRDITIKGRFNKAQVDTAGPLLDIEPHALRMTLSSALPPLPDFYGGTITAPQQRVWIENPEKIHVTPKERAGRLTFELDPVRITGLKLSLPIGGDVGAVDFFSMVAHPKTEGIPFSLDIGTNRLTMTGGTFQTLAKPLSARVSGAISTNEGRVDYSSVSFDRAQIKFSPNTATLELTRVAASVRAIASMPNTPAALFAGKMAASRIDGTTDVATDSARFAELRATNARFASPPGAAACSSAFTATSDIERDFLKTHAIATVADKDAEHLAAALTGLDALPVVEFAMHVPLPRVVAAVDSSVTPETRRRFGAWAARGGTLLSCGDQSTTTDYGEATVRLALRYTPKLDDRQLALTPTLDGTEIVKFETARTMPLQNLAATFIASAAQVATPVQAAAKTVKLPLPIVFDPSIRPTGQNAGVTVLSKSLSTHGPIAPVIVVDASGMHVVGRIQ